MLKEKIFVSILLLVGLLAAMPIYAQTPAEPPSNFDEPDAGTERNPYLISNIANLRWLQADIMLWNKGSYFLQTSDIDATETKSWHNGRGFNPIGRYLIDDMYDHPFIGQYDGGNHIIRNLFFDGEKFHWDYSGYIAMFSSIERASIVNVNLENITIIVSDVYISSTGLIGGAWDSSIINCSVSGSISNANIMESYPNSVSGLVGSAINTRIEGCYSTIEIESIGKIGSSGGLILGMRNSTLKNSFFYGKINVTSDNQRIGGLVGGATNSTIENSYVSSKSAFNEGMAGLVGTMENSTIRNSFFDVEATGVTSLFNEIVGENNVMENNFGLPTSEMKQASTYTEYGWDFTRIWDIDEDINEGYPYLRNTPPPFVSDYDNPIKPLINSIVYPNPVRGEDVTIKWVAHHNNDRMYSVETNIGVMSDIIIIYNIRGQLVKRSREFETRDGENVFVWDRKNEMGHEVASGVYFYQVKVYNETYTGRMVLLK